MKAFISETDLTQSMHASRTGDILVFLTGQAEIEKAVRRLNEGVAGLPEGSAGPLMVLPLYASLPPEMQVCPMPVFLFRFEG